MFSPEGYEALREGAGLFERTDRGRLLLSGGDRRTYLQGILTNDIAALTPGTGCYAAMLTPNGRMIADMKVLELGDRILIDLDAALAPAIRDRLDQFIFAEDVTVADETASMMQAGVYGPRAAPVVASALRAGFPSAGDLPGAAELDALHLFQNVRVGAPGGLLVSRSDDFGVNGFELYAAADGRDALLRALDAAGATPVHREALEVTRVEAGRPLFGLDMTEETIPLEAGIEDRAISHTKGCYVGQEIIVRVLHRGHGRVARKLVGLSVDGPLPVRGATIHAGDREVGAVTSAVNSPRLGHPIALGYVRREHAEPGTAATIGGGADAAAATVVALPFVAQSLPSR